MVEHLCRLSLFRFDPRRTSCFQMHNSAEVCVEDSTGTTRKLSGAVLSEAIPLSTCFPPDSDEDDEETEPERRLLVAVSRSSGRVDLLQISGDDDLFISDEPLTTIIGRRERATIGGESPHPSLSRI